MQAEAYTPLVTHTLNAPKGLLSQRGGKKRSKFRWKKSGKKKVNESNGFFFIIHHRGFGQK